jgi:predicted transcriptional regulator
MDLRTLRESLGKTQGEIARNADMTQPQLSRVERRQDHLISTIRKYVVALGGNVEVVVRVDGRQVILRDI